MATTIRQELEEEFLSTTRKGEEIALEALKPLERLEVLLAKYLSINNFDF